MLPTSVGAFPQDVGIFPTNVGAFPKNVGTFPTDVGKFSPCFFIKKHITSFYLFPIITLKVCSSKYHLQDFSLKQYKYTFQFLEILRIFIAPFITIKNMTTPITKSG